MYFLVMEIFLQTDWFIGRDQQMFDLVFDVLVGWWSMLGLPCCWLCSSWTDGWQGWAARPRPALTPFTVVLAGLPLLPLPRLPARSVKRLQGRFSYIIGQQERIRFLQAKTRRANQVIFVEEKTRP